jgi:UDP-glucose:tetrahydrobiopterin glucosyltransferase
MKERMRIALIAPLVTAIAQPYAGGAQVFVAELAKGMARRGHSITLFARDDSAVPGVALEPIAVPEIVRPADFSTPEQQRPADAGFFAQANLFLELFLSLRRRQHEFDLVHANAFDWPCFACSALIDALPVIHTVHLPAVTPEISEALRALHHQGHPQTLVTVSHACARTYAAYTPFDHIIYNSLDLDAIPFAAQVADDAPLLFAGRITPEKGVEAAIEIAERARSRLLIAGGVYDRRYYEERILPLLKWARGRVTYLGHLEHEKLWQVMGQARALLFPIQWDEPFGLAAIEAMAAGTPVIAFRRGAAEEVIRHGETGFLVGAGDCAQAAALVDGLAALSRAACRAHVARNFSLARMLDAYEHLYDSLLPQT